MKPELPRGPLRPAGHAPLGAPSAGEARPSDRRRWGGLATLLWCLPIFLALHLAGAVGVALDLLWLHLGPEAGGAIDPATGRVADGHWDKLDTRPEVVIATGFALLGLELAVVGSAARLAGARARDYLALKPFTGRDLLFGGAATAAVVLGVEAAAARLGVSLASPWLSEVYGNALAGGTAPLLVLTVAVAAPVWEEAVFRGFLFRGWSGSRLGPAGAVVLTSALWSCLHVQYDAALLLHIFCIGLVFGWVRHRSGSALLTMALHGLNNLAACVEAAAARW